MIKMVPAILAMTMLAACGGSRHKKNNSDTPPDPDPWYSDPGDYYDNGSDDGGYYDPGYDDYNSDDGSDVSEEKASSATEVDSGGTQVVALNYDAAAYTLYVEARDPRAKWRRLYLPPVHSASAGGFSRTARMFRLRPGSPYSLVLEAQDGQTLDIRVLDTVSVPSWRCFTIVGAKLLASQS